MAHVIFNKKTWKLVRMPNGDRAYWSNDRSAKGQFTRLKNLGVVSEETHELCEYNEYLAKIPMVKTRNILNPDAGEIEIRADKLGTASDPGTEAYHQS